MVNAAITARNEADNSIRQWGIGIDTIPTGNWLKDESVIKSTKRSGDLWNVDIPLSNGKHTLYFIISQPNSLDLGTYTGEALFDIAGFNFVGVDNDSVAAFAVEVSDGKAKRASGTPATTDPTDLEDGGRLSRILNFLKNPLAKIEWDRKTWLKAGLVTGVSVGAVVSAAYILPKVRNRGRRKF